MGPFLWSIYHVLLTGLVSVLLRKEGDSLKRILGPVLGGSEKFVVIVVGLLGLSVLLFQVVEPMIVELAYGTGTMERMLSELNRIPLPAAIYGITITSFTAGVCEEIIWRGYLQTRLERKLGGRILTAAGIQAMLFGLWHFVSIHAVFTAISGFIYGLVYARIRRLAPLMTAHWLENMIGFSLLYFNL